MIVSRFKRASRALRSHLVFAGASLALTVLSPGDALANCQNGATTQNVANTDSGATGLNEVLLRSFAPCTITLTSNGVYNGTTTIAIGSDSIFRIMDGIKVVPAAGVSPTLSVPSGSSFAVIFQAFAAVKTGESNPYEGPARCPNNATLEGVTVTGGFGGILVKPVVTGICAGETVSGVSLKNITVNTNSSHASGTHGIELSAVSNSVVDSCTIVTAKTNGIFLEPIAGVGSNNNIIMNNTVQQALDQHAIAVQGSSDNVIVGNTVTSARHDGIILNSIVGPALTGTGSVSNRIDRNTISGHLTDGITLTDGSRFNYVGHNVTTSASYDPITKPTPSPTTGVGIWVNNDSNGVYLFGNETSGSPENGIDVLTSKSAYVHGNRVRNNLQGGIWAANYQFSADNTAAVNQDIVIHANNAFFNTANAQINLQGNTRADVAYNFLSGEQNGNGLSATQASTGTGGIILKRGGTTGVVTPAIPRTDIPVSDANIYENTITDVNTRVLASDISTTGSFFFRNRFLDGTNNPLSPAGKQGLTYAYTGVGITWDASRNLGGNHWSEYTSANGNPDPFRPYKNFVYDNRNGVDGNAPFADKFPYSSENMNATPYGLQSVTVLEPYTAQTIAAGTKKTIRWIARGCTLVDLTIAGGGATSIATSVPNTGLYVWTVPANPTGSSYAITVDCRTSSGGSTGVSGSSDFFKIGTSALTLLNPGRASRANNASTLRVAWKKTAAVTNVNVFVRAAGSVTETQVGTNVTANFVDVTLPSAVNNSLATIRIVDAASASNEDSVDGYFMVRGTGTFNTTFSGQNLLIGSIQSLAWSGYSTSYTVDLDVYEGGVLAKSIVKNLPDFGNFTWFVPEMWSVSSFIRATFKDANGTSVGTADTGTFRVSYLTTTGTAVNRYRLYSPVTLEHHFTTDQNEYNVLGTQVGTWIQEGAASKMHNGPMSMSGVEAVPYYRLYDQISKWHHWTTDRNEYFTLRLTPSRYVAEGVDGYIFKTQPSGTTAWYRLNLGSLHHWTADLNERNTLILQGWNEEQKEYVIPN